MLGWILDLGLGERRSPSFINTIMASNILWVLNVYEYQGLGRLRGYPKKSKQVLFGKIYLTF